MLNRNPVLLRLGPVPYEADTALVRIAHIRQLCLLDLPG